MTYVYGVYSRCGHIAPHSIARKRQEPGYCPACECDMEFVKWLMQRAAIRAAEWERQRATAADKQHNRG